MQLQKKSMWLLLHVIVATCAREPSSPACSRYDYEERLLERVLRNELALETTLNEIVKTNAKVLDALKQLEDAKHQLKVPTIYFLARMTSSQTAVSSGQDVVFPMMEVNEGRGYDHLTGKFTASVSGMYLFSVQYCASQNKSVYLEIVHQGNTVQRAYHYDASGHSPCMTMQASAAVAMGHQVWVRATGSTTTLFTDSWRYTSFSGTLIHV